MNVLQQYPETMNSQDLQIWNNAAFDNGESENSANVKFSWSGLNPLSSINLSQSIGSDSTKENRTPLMAESPVSLKSLSEGKPLQDNIVIRNAQNIPICKMGVLEKGNQLEEKDIDFEIEEIEKEINRLSSRLESLRIEKAKQNAKMMEKKGRIVAAKFMDPPKQSTRSSNEQNKFEDSMSLSAKLKTPRRGLSMGPAEIMRSVRRGISLGPVEIYLGTKLKHFGKQDAITPGQQSANRRKSCYWKLHDVDELRVTKERGKSMSLSPKARSTTAVKAQVPKPAATTIGSKKTAKKEDAVISSIQPKKLFAKDGEKSGPAKKPIKSGRVVPSRYNQVSNGGNSAVKELRKRSLSENEEDYNRSDKKRVSLTEKTSGGEQLATESRVKKRWEIPSDVVIQTNVDHKTPSSVSKMVDMVPKIKNLRCKNESPRDSGPAKRVAELVGRKSFFSTEDGVDEEAEESVCQALSFAEEQVVQECPKIRIIRHVNESPRDSGAVKRVSQLVGRKSFFHNDEDEMPVFSFEEDDSDEN
ncbi:uncharacterized protein LOC110734059 [Chenopodium quinoa]|uniref:uncharacterized protein LOC110734059 n=1 Tax=Chenopodium quinoa TaxID=63459 RepID=UPI000B78F8DD|nr:uncharacterized protein LOC110734059 [Chenopodium quinoa]